MCLSQGEKFRVIGNAFVAVLEKRTEFQKGLNDLMTDEFTFLAIEELNQMGKLDERECSLVDQKVSLLRERVSELSSYVMTKKKETKKDLQLD